MKKYIANLNGEAAGHIIIDSENFTWKPMFITKIFSFGTIKEFSIPIKFIEGYKISKILYFKHLQIAVKGEDMMIDFECNPLPIVEKLKTENPYIRMIE